MDRGGAAVTCDCRHERDGRCTLHPKVRVNITEWDGLHNCKKLVEQWQHPPADAECGQRAPRDAAPAAAEPKMATVFATHRFFSPDGMPSSVCAVCLVGYKLAPFVACLPQPTPPPAAPQPSEAAKAWAVRCHRAIVDWSGYATATEVSHLKLGAHQRMCAAVEEAVALIAAAEQRASEAEAVIRQHDLCHDQHGKVTAEQFAECCAKEQRKLYGKAPHADERDALRAKLAAAERARDYAFDVRDERIEERDAARRDLAAAQQALAALLSVADTFARAMVLHCEPKLWSMFRDARDDARKLCAAEAGRQEQELPKPSPKE
jgi:hypothetical protein